MLDVEKFASISGLRVCVISGELRKGSRRTFSGWRECSYVRWLEDVSLIHGLMGLLAAFHRGQERKQIQILGLVIPETIEANAWIRGVH